MYQYTEEDMYWAFKKGQQWHKDLTDGKAPKPFPDSMADKFPNKFRQADVSCLLPTLEEVRAAIKEIGKKSTAPDKETPNWMEKDIENGINWALNYVVKKSKGNSN